MELDELVMKIIAMGKEVSYEMKESQDRVLWHTWCDRKGEGFDVCESRASPVRNEEN